MIWQEYDCPTSGIDFDLVGDEILAVGESCACSGCGGRHTAGADIQMQTAVQRGEGEIEWRGLPASPDEKRPWLLADD